MRPSTTAAALAGLALDRFVLRAIGNAIADEAARADTLAAKLTVN